MEQRIRQLEQVTEHFLLRHAVGDTGKHYGKRPIAGEFSVHWNAEHHDLFGMLDAVYILTTLGVLADRTDRASRQVWANRILACQDDLGWFSKLNLHRHSVEHTSAYAIGALCLLQLEADEDYLSAVRPITPVYPILADEKRFRRWIYWMGLTPSKQGFDERRLGWHYVWRGSHVGGGVAAIVGMMQHTLAEWWGPSADVERWFGWYFDWLDARINASTGLWQRGLHNIIIKRPLLTDMAGAVHFFWNYDAADRAFPYPEQVIESTLPLQRDTGLYRDHPFCIDYDANFCLVRSFLQLQPSQQDRCKRAVVQALERNFEGVVDALLVHPMHEIYSDTHGLTGALAALTECAKFPGFRYTESIAHWQHPMDRTWWL